MIVIRLTPNETTRTPNKPCRYVATAVDGVGMPMRIEQANIAGYASHPSLHRIRMARRAIKETATEASVGSGLEPA